MRSTGQHPKFILVARVVHIDSTFGHGREPLLRDFINDDVTGRPVCIDKFVCSGFHQPGGDFARHARNAGRRHNHSQLNRVLSRPINPEDVVHGGTFSHPHRDLVRGQTPTAAQSANAQGLGNPHTPGRHQIPHECRTCRRLGGFAMSGRFSSAWFGRRFANTWLGFSAADKGSKFGLHFAQVRIDKRATLAAQIGFRLFGFPSRKLALQVPFLARHVRRAGGTSFRCFGFRLATGFGDGFGFGFRFRFGFGFGFGF